MVPGCRIYDVHEHWADGMILSIRRAYSKEIIQSLGEASIWEFVRSEFLAFWEECYGS